MNNRIDSDNFLNYWFWQEANTNLNFIFKKWIHCNQRNTPQLNQSSNIAQVVILITV